MADHFRDALDALDAAVFSGVGFVELRNRKLFENFLGRWQRSKEVFTKEVEREYNDLDSGLTLFVEAATNEDFRRWVALPNEYKAKSQLVECSIWEGETKIHSPEPTLFAKFNLESK